MFWKIIQFIKEWVNKMIGKSSIKEALKVDVNISPEMANALDLWAKMYENKAPWLNKDIHSLNLASAISSEISRAVTIEMNVEVSGSARADYLALQINKIIPKLRQYIEFGCAKGGLMMKPFPNGKDIDVDFVQADQFYPISFDSNQNITSAVFADQRRIENDYYTRLEYHSITKNGYEIRNAAFKSSTKNVLGKQVPLTSVYAWKDLQEQAIITDIDRPLFAYFRFPLANNVDSAYPIGISCFARSVDLIQQADIQWSNLLWEFESGQRALYADVVAFEKKADGTLVLPNKRLYRALNGTSNVGDNPEGLFHEWTPTLREQNILAGLDAILKKIEFTCALSYGTISDPNIEVKTATELKIGKQRTYAMITDTQKALQSALDQLLYAMDVYTSVYNLAPSGIYKAVYDFDDSVIVDKEWQFQSDLRLVTGQIMSRVEFRMRNFGEDEATARQKIAEIRAEQPQEILGD